jgi:hypothetical protein
MWRQPPAAGSKADGAFPIMSSRNLHKNLWNRPPGRKHSTMAPHHQEKIAVPP